MIKDPLIRTAADLDRNVRDLQSRQGHADLHWRWDIHTSTGAPCYTLRTKHPWSPTVSPVKVTFGVVRPNPTSDALVAGWRFGFPHRLRIDGKLVRNFKVEGPPIVAWRGQVDFLEIGPSEPGPSRPVTLHLARQDGLRSRSFLATACGTSQGAEGFTVEMSVGGRMRLMFWCPKQADAANQGRVDVTVDALEGAPVSDAFDIAELVRQMQASTEIRLSVDGGGGFSAQYDVIGMAPDDYAPVWLLADDLRHLELHTGARFRFPGPIKPRGRVMIRNVCLMLTGKTVAHPLWNLYTAEVQGQIEGDVAVMLAEREPGQVSVINASPEDSCSTVEILGEPVEVPGISVYVMLTIDETHRRDVRDGLELGESQTLRLTCRSGDRLRRFMESRMDPNTSLAITLWNIPGIRQKGILEDTPVVGPGEAA